MLHKIVYRRHYAFHVSTVVPADWDVEVNGEYADRTDTLPPIAVAVISRATRRRIETKLVYNLDQAQSALEVLLDAFYDAEEAA